MSVEVWYGDKLPHGAEQETLLRLYQYLRIQDEHFVLLHNFFAGHGNEIDLVVLKHNGVFLAELKHVWNRIVGSREGDWKAICKDGTEVILNRNRPNPFRQVRHNYFSWREWCHAHAKEIRTDLGRARPMDWAGVITYIVLYPDLPEGSDIDIGDGPVQAVGLPDFLFALLVRSSVKVNLSRREMSRVPKLIGLKVWPLEPSTEELLDWQPMTFATLVARGHTLSVPIFRLDEIGEQVVTVGRAPDNDLIIADPTVSRSHAQLCYHRDRGCWVVRDLNSSSGTFVSYDGAPGMERPVLEAESRLRNNSIVRFGPAAYTLLLSIGEEP